MNKSGILLLTVLISFFILLKSGANIAHADSFDDQVVRSFFTTKIKNGKPVNEVLILENNIRNIYFYSELKNMKGRTITHNWEHRGKKVFKKKFKVKTDFERLISKYQLNQNSTGEWMVLIRDEKNQPLKAVMFKYLKKGSLIGKGVLPVK